MAEATEKKETVKKPAETKKAPPPAAKPPAAKADAVKPATKIKITLVKSLTGRHEKHIATARSLGLKKIGNFTMQPDNPMTRGKIAQINYLINVEENKQ